LGWTALAKLASVLVTLRRPAGSGAEARPRRTRTAESSWPGKLSKASPHWPRREPLADSAAAAGWLSPRFANRDFRSSIRSCRIEYPHAGAVQAQAVCTKSATTAIAKSFLTRIVCSRRQFEAIIRHFVAHLLGQRHRRRHWVLAATWRPSSAATAGVADGSEAAARSTRPRIASGHARGRALTRCFDLISNHARCSTAASVAVGNYRA
jgi:hypothetical protein